MTAQPLPKNSQILVISLMEVGRAFHKTAALYENVKRKSEILLEIEKLTRVMLVGLFYQSKTV